MFQVQIVLCKQLELSHKCLMPLSSVIEKQLIIAEGVKIVREREREKRKEKGLHSLQIMANSECFRQYVLGKKFKKRKKDSPHAKKEESNK